MSFYFAKSMDTLGEPEFKAPIVEAMEAAADRSLIYRHFPLLQTVVRFLPVPLTKMIFPQASAISGVRRILSARIKQVKANPFSLDETSHPVILRKLLLTKGTGKEKALNELSLLDEAQSLLFNGSEPVSNQIMLGTWHVLENQDLTRRLKSELSEAWPVLGTTPKFEDLEKLPFLVIPNLLSWVSTSNVL